MTDLTLTEIARALAARRRILAITCRICGAVVTGRAHRRYCSDRCRQRAHRDSVRKNLDQDPQAAPRARPRHTRHGDTP